MPRPTAIDRAALDQCIPVLARLGDGLTLEDFRTAAIREADRVARRVRRDTVLMSLFFLVLAIAILARQPYVGNPSSANAMIYAALWCIALGGLGAIASIFLHLLKLVPQQTLNASDRFEFFGRIILGCLFSLVISISMVPNVHALFMALETINRPGATGNLPSSPLLLLPFLLGYSIPLVLRLLEKIMQAVELTLGAEDSRMSGTTMRTQRRQRRG